MVGRGSRSCTRSRAKRRGTLVADPPMDAIRRSFRWEGGNSRLVGATGFEPATTYPPCKCATGLRHAPTLDVLPHRSPRQRPEETGVTRLAHSVTAFGPAANRQSGGRSPPIGTPSTPAGQRARTYSSSSSMSLRMAATLRRRTTSGGRPRKSSCSTSAPARRSFSTLRAPSILKPSS